jgi:FlaA1/EpsC-like NDP-sugar epimerase
MEGGEIYVKKIPSMKLIDIAKAVDSEAQLDIVGTRPGEKLHEQMIGLDDAPLTYEYDDYYKILPAIHNWDTTSERIKNGKKVSEDFQYASNSNSEWMSVPELSAWINLNRESLGKI